MKGLFKIVHRTGFSVCLTHWKLWIYSFSLVILDKITTWSPWHLCNTSKTTSRIGITYLRNVLDYFIGSYTDLRSRFSNSTPLWQIFSINQSISIFFCELKTPRNQNARKEIYEILLMKEIHSFSTTWFSFRQPSFRFERASSIPTRHIRTQNFEIRNGHRWHKLNNLLILSSYLNYFTDSSWIYLKDRWWFQTVYFETLLVIAFSFPATFLFHIFDMIPAFDKYRSVQSLKWVI